MQWQATTRFILQTSFCAWAAVVPAAAAAATDTEVLRWIPADTRVIFQIDPTTAAAHPRAREALGVDALMAPFAAPRVDAAKLRRVTVAYVSAAGAVAPVAFTQGQSALTGEFARLHGDALDTVAGRKLFKAKAASGGAAGGALVLVEGCIVEGGRTQLHTVLTQSASTALTLAGEGHAAAGQLFGVQSASPVSLVYIAPGEGADLYAVMQDLDRILGADIAKALQPYQKPIQMLGTTEGVRLDMRQEGTELATTLWMVMPNAMAAQITSVSLDAGRDMARVAAAGAVKQGSMSASDARALEAALETMHTAAQGDVVKVSLRVPQEPAATGSR